MIELKQVSKLFDGKAAVAGIDLVVPRGRVYGLIGPNGAGKTTSLKMMATLIKPDEGTVTIGGHVLPEGVAEARRKIGYMADRQGTFRGLTAIDYLSFFGRMHGLHGAALRARSDAVLDLTDLGRVREELVSALSMGMRQRLALAKTLLHDPDLLILDEPASGLDPRARIEIRELLKELGRMGKTVVISSHILADLEEICTDIAIIELGKLVSSGSLEAIRGAARVGRRAVRVRVPAAALERARAAAQAVAGVFVVDVVGGTSGGDLRVEVDGVGGNPILAALIAQEIEILAFSEERASLEAIFIDQTKGVVQ